VLLFSDDAGLAAHTEPALLSYRALSLDSLPARKRPRSWARTSAALPTSPPATTSSRWWTNSPRVNHLKQPLPRSARQRKRWPVWQNECGTTPCSPPTLDKNTGLMPFICAASADCWASHGRTTSLTLTSCQGRAAQHARHPYSENG